MTLASMATDFILSAHAQYLAARPGDSRLGPFFHFFKADRRTAGAERAREGIHIVERLEDEPVTFHGLAENHAGAKAECPHRLGRERGLKSGRYRGLRRDSPGCGQLSLESRHVQRIGIKTLGSIQNSGPRCFSRRVCHRVSGHSKNPLRIDHRENPDSLQSLAGANDPFTKMPDKTKERDRTVTALLAQVKATTGPAKFGRNE